MAAAASLFRTLLLGLLLGVAVFGVYQNSFENEFQFDDGHSVVRNPTIRSLSNIPSFFRDGRTFSVLPSNQSYRPLVTASLAIDYWIGEGLDPFYFHLSTFFWFLIQLGCMYLFFVRLADLVTQKIDPSKSRVNQIFALVMVAWYGLHPALADTVNYVIQRGELYATFSVVLAFVLYQYFPNQRRFGIYLLPIAIGTLAKPPAIMFAPILFLYILFFERDAGLCVWEKGYQWRRLWGAFKSSLPAFGAAVALYKFQAVMTPVSFTPGGTSLVQYMLTQPFIHLYYVRTLFVPNQLSIDSDFSLFTDMSDPRALAGFVFYAVLILIIFYCSRPPALRPISFGLGWFVLALFPTTVVPLAEVTNNHRMFFPFIGLILSVCWAIRLLLSSRLFAASANGRIGGRAVVAGLLALLPVYAYGTMQRNEVWHTDETLWLDAATKSPQNGRALMNYGLTQMAKAKYTVARDYFLRAERLTPTYPLLQINLGIVEGALGRSKEAEQRFHRAIALGPRLSSPYFYYARWLKDQGRLPESLRNLDLALAFAPEDFIARYMQLEIALKQKDWTRMRKLSSEMLQRAPGDAETLDFRSKAEAGERQEIEWHERVVAENPTVENLITLSFVYYKANRMRECIQTADRVLAIDPRSAVAYSNKSAAYAELSQWSESIHAAKEALKIDPTLAIARNNLAWAQDELKKQ